MENPILVETWWLLSLRVFGLLSSSLLLFPERFGRMSSGVYRTQEPWWIFELRCGNNKEDEDNCPKTLNDKNHQALSQKFRQQTSEEGWRTYWPKRCRNNNKDEDNSPKTYNDKKKIQYQQDALAGNILLNNLYEFYNLPSFR